MFEGLGQMPDEVHLKVGPAVQPVQMPLRRLPIRIKDSVERELQQMCRDGIIEPVSKASAWLSAFLVVPKPNGRIRIRVGPKPLNRALQRSQYRMPTIDDVLPLLTNAKIFSLVDAKNGFWLLKLDDQSSKLTSCSTPLVASNGAGSLLDSVQLPKYFRPEYTKLSEVCWKWLA